MTQLTDSMGDKVRQLEVESGGDAVKYVHDLIDYINGQKTAQKGWGTYTITLGYRGKGLDSVDIQDNHSLKFKPKG